MSNWAAYEGRMVENWRLDSLLGVRGNVAFYLTEGGEQNRDRLVEIVQGENNSTPAAESWKRARELSGKQFLNVCATGETKFDGSKLAYAVMDLPEDDLGEMLTRRTLEEPEAQSMFAAVARGLDELHKLGLAHGAVAPSSIFMVDGTARLGVDTISPAGKRGIDRDLRQLGATLVKAMTACADGELQDAPSIARAAAQLPSRLKEVVIGCVGGSSNGKWSASRVVEALSDRPAATPSATARAARIPGRMVTVGGIVIVALLLFLVFGRSRHNTPENQPAAVSETTPPPQTAAPARVPPPDKAPVRTEAASPPPPASAPVEKPSAFTPPTSSEKQAAAEPASATTAERSRPAEPAPRTTGKIGETWAVIAGTYKQFEAAQKHANIYGKQLPQLRPHVFPPEGQGRRYLIVLASGLTQQEAERLREEVVEQGAPPDTYVTKIAEN